MADRARTTTDIEELLDLEEIDTDLYRGLNDATSEQRQGLFGGQVAAQALRAAAYTVPHDRLPNSLHGYFLRPGRSDRSVIFKVERERDGRSFSSRHVLAVQNGEVIFSMSTSFHALEDGVEWSTPRVPAAGPDDLPVHEVASGSEGILEHRQLPPVVPYRDDDWPLAARQWFRARKRLPDDPVIHACVLTHGSDAVSGFGDGTAEGLPRGGPSIDHIMWFHEPIRADDWVLVETWPLKAGRGRGLYAGTMQNQSGQLGAMLAQEALLRVGHPLVTRPVNPT